MTQQMIYQAIVCILRATQIMSEQLGPAREAVFRARIEALETASRCALKARDSTKLRALCDEVSQLGDEVKSLV